MRWISGIFALCMGAGVAFADTPPANRRVALIVENSSYQSGGGFSNLANPERDAALVHDALVRAGFDNVSVVHNVSRANFVVSLQEFQARTAGSEIALIYYAGHGLSALGDNWLAPVDMDITTDDQLRENAISQTQLLAAVRRARMGIVVLDACRDSPFAKLANKPGLAAFEADGVLLMYSAGSGHEAFDGPANLNSPFAIAFARRVTQPGLPVQLLPSFVRDDVIHAEIRQRPYASTSVATDPLYLLPGDARCAMFDKRWMDGLMASADVAVLQQFINASPPTCVSRSEASRRVGSLPGRETVPLPVVANRFRDCSSCPWMIALPGGSYDMGSSAEDHDRYSAEIPVRRAVRVAPFAAGIFEVTFDEWDACVADGGCGHYMADDAGWGRGSMPVVSVSWNDAKRYVDWLSRRTGRPYRLLSEAEWEYAARGGVDVSRFWWGNTIDRSRANYGAEEDCERGAGAAVGPDRWLHTAPVGSFSPNPFGLYDMIGNVWEWVEDCEHADYAGAPPTSAAWTTSCLSQRRELRGGSWYDCPRWVRTANRYPDAPIVRSDNYGFRVAREM